MGNCVDFNKFANIYSHHPDVGQYQEDFYCLNITEESIGQLYKVFQRIDLDHSGFIDSKELFQKLHLDNSKFARRIFRMYDLDKSGKIDFREFVLISWNFCTIEKNSLEKFIFDMYDFDGLGCIQMREVETFIKDIYGKEFLTNQNVQRALQEGLPQCLDKYSDAVTTEVFPVFCERHPYILYPITIMQSNFRNFALGTDYWRDQMRNRIDICDGVYIPFPRLFRELRSGKRDRTKSDTLSEKVLRRQLSNVKRDERLGHGFVEGSEMGRLEGEDRTLDTTHVSRISSQDRNNQTSRSRSESVSAGNSPGMRVTKSISSKQLSIKDTGVLPSAAIAARKKSASRRSYSSSSVAVDSFLQKQISRKSLLKEHLR